MRTNFGQLLVLGLIYLLCSTGLWGQNIKVNIGADEIAANEAFTITVVVENDPLKNLSGFPEIEGMVKRGTSSSTSTQFINGQVSSTQSLTQNYVAQRQGTFRLPTFTITVNGQNINVPGKTMPGLRGPHHATERKHRSMANMWTC